jgi:hypothetical protein
VDFRDSAQAPRRIDFRRHKYGNLVTDCWSR